MIIKKGIENYLILNFKDQIEYNFINSRLKSYYGDPSTFKATEESVLLVNDDISAKWKQVPASCK